MASTTETTEEFEAKIESIVSSAFINTSVSLGYELGLFDVLAKENEYKTSQEIADLGNWKERYVRELLNTLTIARIIELDYTGDRYLLPEHRARVLTRDGSQNGTLEFGTLVPAISGSIFKEVKECFKKEGPRGVPFDAYNDMMDKFSGWSASFVRDQLHSVFITPYPELKEKLGKGIAVLEVGCGKGAAAIEFGKGFPNSSVCGVDILERSIKVARESALHHKNVSFVAQDAASLPADWTSKFDFVFMHDTLHDQAYPDRVLSEVYRVLAPGGICSISEIMSHTKVKDNLEKSQQNQMSMIYTSSLFHCMPVSLYFEGGMGLGSAWGKEKAVEMITAAGIQVVETREIPAALGICYYCKKV